MLFVGEHSLHDAKNLMCYWGARRFRLPAFQWRGEADGSGINATGARFEGEQAEDDKMLNGA